MKDGSWYTSDRLRWNHDRNGLEKINYSKFLSQMYQETDLLERKKNERIYYPEYRVRNWRRTFKGQWTYRLKHNVEALKNSQTKMEL